MFRAIGRVVVGVSDQDEALAFYRDVLGFEVLHDSDDEGLRYLHIGLPGQPDTGLWLMPGAAEHDRPLLVLYADDLAEIVAGVRAARGGDVGADRHLAALPRLLRQRARRDGDAMSRVWSEAIRRLSLAIERLVRR